MKGITKAWGIKFPDGHIFPYADYSRARCIREFKGWPVGKNWAYLYRKGYRCIRINIMAASAKPTTAAKGKI